ncbi:Gfo/Idh/MocA family oxidoreductase [Sphingomonas sp. 7/4-4]|nr:Gfo/Idh/MocA family oxidoreductase [Sphingomonas sp. 7/4-4]WBY09841.1 Gfo/Idh/MocA family oxidoreductase [Sphingomonas sp. 7/4-4]
MKEVHKHADAQIVAVCDVDTVRLGAGKELVDTRYAASTGKPYSGTRMYHDYRELLANKEIDAVLISTPDHQHAPQAVHAVRAGKHVYLQKPAALTISEGRAMADAVKASGRIVQIGSQQRGQDPGRNSTAPASWSATAASARSFGSKWGCPAILLAPRRRRCRCRRTSITTPGSGPPPRSPIPRSASTRRTRSRTAPAGSASSNSARA